MYAKILVLLEPGYGDEGQQAVQAARTLAGPDGAVQVLTVYQELPTYYGLEVDSDLVKHGQKETFARIVADFELAESDVLVMSGHVVRVVLETAEEGGHDCIVVASHQPGWGHRLLGSTAAAVVRQSHCSVHVCRVPE